MYKVTIHPPGTTFPPNGLPVFTLYYRNDDGGPGYGKDSRLFFDPPADGDVPGPRRRRPRRRAAPTYAYRLTVRPPRPSFTVSFSPTAPACGRAAPCRSRVTADRIDGFDGPIACSSTNLPPGFERPGDDIEAGENSDRVRPVRRRRRDGAAGRGAQAASPGR